MKVALICFSLTGQQTGERLCRGLEAAGMTAELDKKSKYLPDSIQVSTSAWAGEKFSDSDALIFIGATGIAVRSIAPYVASKKSDPAVLVVDECGKFVISLLSGHLGGANELALKTAEILEAIPVVTTATDLHHRFAVDVFAKKNNCSIFNMKAAKEVHFWQERKSDFTVSFRRTMNCRRDWSGVMNMGILSVVWMTDQKRKHRKALILMEQGQTVRR